MYKSIVSYSHLLFISFVTLIPIKSIAQADKLLEQVTKGLIENSKNSTNEIAGKVYIATTIDPNLNKEKAIKIVKTELDKWIYPVVIGPEKTEPAYFNDSANYVSKRIKDPIIVTEDYVQFNSSSSDTIKINFSDILYDEIILSSPFKDGVTCRFTVNKHNFRSCHNEFADALHYLRYNYSINFYSEEIEKFKSIAENFLNLEESPKLSEEQRKYIIQANAMNEARKYKNAIKLYNKVMDLNPISYPSGYYNLALIASLDENYPFAVFCMKKYLMLLPNAEDAREAQDKIYEWEAFLQ